MKTTYLLRQQFQDSAWKSQSDIIHQLYQLLFRSHYKKGSCQFKKLVIFRESKGNGESSLIKGIICLEKVIALDHK